MRIHPYDGSFKFLLQIFNLPLITKIINLVLV